MQGTITQRSEDPPRQRLRSRTKFLKWDNSFLNAVACQSLNAGQVGYLICNIKTGSGSSHRRYGHACPAKKVHPLWPVIAPPQRMVYCGLYPSDGEELRRARDVAQRNFRSTIQASNSHLKRATPLGFGFRCGFLGLLHMEIIQQRLGA